MGANFDANKKAADIVQAIAADSGQAFRRLAMAWILARAEFILPIPGTKRRHLLEENLAADAGPPLADQMTR
jgi:aryl-alcohol dehydrogenase-like predicted oxidoreductase